jgi:hypothetical protein
VRPARQQPTPSGRALLTFGFVAGTVQDVIAQEVQNPGGPINWNHAVCAGGAGAAGSIPVVGSEARAIIYNVIQTVAGS